MSRTPPPPRPTHELKRKNLCDVCGNKRSTGNHAQCSVIRQAKFAKENAK